MKILWLFYDVFYGSFYDLSFFSAHVALKKHKKIIKFSLKKSHLFQLKKS